MRSDDDIRTPGKAMATSSHVKKKAVLALLTEPTILGILRTI